MCAKPFPRALRQSKRESISRSSSAIDSLFWKWSSWEQIHSRHNSDPLFPPPFLPKPFSLLGKEGRQAHARSHISDLPSMQKPPATRRPFKICWESKWLMGLLSFYKSDGFHLLLLIQLNKDRVKKFTG